MIDRRKSTHTLLSSNTHNAKELEHLQNILIEDNILKELKDFSSEVTLNTTDINHLHKDYFKEIPVFLLKDHYNKAKKFLRKNLHFASQEEARTFVATFELANINTTFLSSQDQENLFSNYFEAFDTLLLADVEFDPNKKYYKCLHKIEALEYIIKQVQALEVKLSSQKQEDLKPIQEELQKTKKLFCELFEQDNSLENRKELLHKIKESIRHIPSHKLEKTFYSFNDDNSIFDIQKKFEQEREYIQEQSSYKEITNCTFFPNILSSLEAEDSF